VRPSFWNLTTKLLWIPLIELFAWTNILDADAEMNIFERAKQLAETGRSLDAIIRTLKAERYEMWRPISLRASDAS
jgi:hypothetical protein